MMKTNPFFDHLILMCDLARPQVSHKFVYYRIVYVVTFVNDRFCFRPGISRKERWERAEVLGLNPPKVVKDTLEKHPKDPKFSERYEVLDVFIH